MTRLPLAGGHQPLVLELDLSRGLHEAAPVSPLGAVRSRRAPTLRRVVEALTRAADDPRVAGLVAHVGHRDLTFGQSLELRRAVAALRAAGRLAVCWSESFGELGPGNVGYHLASAFDEVWLQPSGDLGLVGVRAEAVFAKDALAKAGVQVQLGRRHEYKSAADVFLESSLTAAHREMLERLVGSATETLVADVARGRALPEAEVRAAIDAAPLSAEEAQRRRLVDRLGYRDEVYAQVRGRLGEVELRYVERYGSVRTRMSVAAGAVARPRKPVVAVVQATGPIHLGRSTASPVGGRSIGSDTLGAALRDAARHDQVRAVVLRVDSPGGSYVASDAIRREVLALRESGRQVVASMADVAGSGGYYIAMPADWVVANATTLTGSIGVVAGKQVLRDALARLGVNRESVAGGRNADMFSTQRPFDAEEWERLESWLDRVYDDFTAKAAVDRRLPVEQLRAVARGRVWTGADALARGLVDELGGLDAAVDAACARIGVSRSEVDVRTLPRVSPLARIRPPESSESPAAARVLGHDGLLERLAAALHLPAAGALTMPVTYRLR